jgi:hypothetical protein
LFGRFFMKIGAKFLIERTINFFFTTKVEI